MTCIFDSFPFLRWACTISTFQNSCFHLSFFTSPLFLLFNKRHESVEGGFVSFSYCVTISSVCDFCSCCASVILFVHDCCRFFVIHLILLLDTFVAFSNTSLYSSFDSLSIGFDYCRFYPFLLSLFRHSRGSTYEGSHASKVPRRIIHCV